MVAGIIFVALMLGLYFATERGVFESEPAGIESLREQNTAGETTWLSGQVAWLKLDGTHIDYPVMQTGDNDWYLSHDYYGDESSSGAVFLDYRNTADFSDRLSIIYGHRMNGDLIFSDVAKYRNSDYFAEHTTGELATPNQVFTLHVLAFREVAADAELYRSLVSREFDRPVLILSTCDRAARSKRDILILALDNRGEIW